MVYIALNILFIHSIIYSMKRFEEFDSDDLWNLRQQIVLNSLFIADYRNNMGIDENSVCEFFDGFMSYITELGREAGIPDEEWTEFWAKYDNKEYLEEWFYCFDDFSWVKYNEDFEEENDIDSAV